MEIPSADFLLFVFRGDHVVGLAERAWPGRVEADGPGLHVAVAIMAQWVG